MKPRLVIWGAGGHAAVVSEIVRLQGVFELAGFVDDASPERKGESFAASRILGGRESLDALHEQGVRAGIIAVGDCRARARIASLMTEQGFRLATAIHPAATVSEGADIGAGTIIAANAVVSVGVRIGSNVIVNTSASVDHHCTIADDVHISPRVVLGGNVTVGRGTWIGIGATVKDHVHIGTESVIGAGAVVVRDVPDAVVAYGVPARVQSKRVHHAE